MEEAAPTLGEFFEAWDLFRDPVLTGMAAGLLLGFLGIFVVLRRMVFVSAALSQAAALGVSLTFLAEMMGMFGEAKGEPIIGALVFALLAMAVFARNTERIRVTREGLLGLGYLTGSAGALLVGDRIQQGAHDVSAILFGIGVAVREIDVKLTIGAAAVLLPLNLWALRGIVFTSFDEESARVQQLPTRWINRFLFLSIGLAVAVTTHAIGAMSVFALTVLPAMTVLALSRRFLVVLIVSPLLGMLWGGAGYLAAYLYKFPVGGSQSFLACMACAAAIAIASIRPRD